MQRIIATLSLSFLFAGLSACSSPAEKMTGHVEEMAKISEDNKSNCDEMAKALKAYDKEHDLQALKKKLSDMDKEDREKAAEEYGDRIEKAAKTLIGNAFPCAMQGTDFGDALKRAKNE